MWKTHIRLALSGTPWDAGKSPSAGLLSSHGMSISNIEELAQTSRCALEEVDATDGAHPVDMGTLCTIHKSKIGSLKLFTKDRK